MSICRQVLAATIIGTLFTAAVYAIAVGIPFVMRSTAERVDDPTVTAVQPIISMTVGEQVVDGIEGSYCTTQLCVDKVGPTGFTDVTFIPIDSNDITISLRNPAHEVTIGLRDENGMTLLCDMRVVKQNDTTYTATICDDGARDHYVDVGAWWTEGGDASYYFPVATK